MCHGAVVEKKFEYLYQKIVIYFEGEHKH